MGIFGNILLFVMAAPILAVCLNGIAGWLGMGEFLSANTFAFFTKPILIMPSFTALVFGIARIREYIKRNKDGDRELQLHENIEERKRKWEQSKD